MQKLIINIKELVGILNNSQPIAARQLKDLQTINNAFIFMEDGLIKSYGATEQEADFIANFSGEIIDAKDATILPCYCDSHTHLVFAATREEEFVDKLNGLSYAQIAAKGGGILNSAAKLATATEEELYQKAWYRLQQVMAYGTGAIEIKSGYGLSVEAELKMLRVIKQLKANSPIPIKASFLGAHAFPTEFKENKEGYVQLIINEMLPQIAKENLADFVDVFCEEGFFSVAQTLQICEAAKGYGLIPKLHVNQLNSIGGLQAAIKLNALSVDHLETLSTNDISDIEKAVQQGWHGFCTLLPTAAFFLRMPYPPFAELVKTNCNIALASDYNPGSSPSGNMNFVNALSCIQMKMLPNEVINASTINGAYAMQLEEKVGSITKGKFANLIFTKPIPNLSYLHYSFAENLIDKVMVKGEFI